MSCVRHRVQHQTLNICELLQDNGVPLASNQVQYSLLYRVPERNGVADAVRDAGATLIAYSPLCQGLLTGGVVPIYELPA
jgi:aryl-alcohol dehydrogenase-like predicted oxidoreductase